MLKAAGILTVLLLLAGSAWSKEDCYDPSWTQHSQCRVANALEDIAAALKGAE